MRITYMKMDGEYTNIEDDVKKNEIAVEVLWAGFLILVVGTVSAFADIGATMFIMYTINGDYGKSIEYIYKGFFTNGGMSFEVRPRDHMAANQIIGPLCVH